MTIRNGQSRDTDIDIHKKKTLEMGQSGQSRNDIDTLEMRQSETLTFDIHKKKTLEMTLTIRNGQSRDTDIDIHKKKTLEMGQSEMDNLETLTLIYTRKRR